MSYRPVVHLSLAFGLLTAVVLWLGYDTIGGLMALVQIGFLAGAPLALQLQDALRSRTATVVAASVASLALAAIAVQVLIWFRQATPELIVVSATAYGAVMATLLGSADPADGRARARSGRRIRS